MPAVTEVITVVIVITFCGDWGSMHSEAAQGAAVMSFPAGMLAARCVSCIWPEKTRKGRACGRYM